MMHLRPLSLVGAALTCVLVPLASTARDPVDAPDDGSVCYAFETVAQGQMSGFGAFCGGPLGPSGPASGVIPPCTAAVAAPAFEAVIRSDCAWRAFWAQHGSNSFPAPPAPAVDFARYVVVAVVSGSRSNGCYGMSISHITRGSGGARVVHVRERVACPGEPCTQAITNNFHFVKVCRALMPLDRPVCFEHRNLEVRCHRTLDCRDQ